VAVYQPPLCVQLGTDLRLKYQTQYTARTASAEASPMKNYLVPVALRVGFLAMLGALLGPVY
jgi:hypothetical protein